MLVRFIHTLSILILLQGLLSCASVMKPETTIADATLAPNEAPPPAESSRENSGPILLSGESSDSLPDKAVFVGTGQQINTAPTQQYRVSDGDISLNFANSPIAEVVATVLGDILQVNYTIAPGVSGNVSMRTARPIAKDALITVLDNMLRMNGAAVLKTGDFYEVLPIDDGLKSLTTPAMRLSADRGYQVVIMPLEFIGAREMAKILEPVKSGKATVQVDEYRNMLTLAGTQSELFSLRETISIFDVDQLAGMSVGLFRLSNVEAPDLLVELEAIFGVGADGPLAGMVRFTVIDRLNALLVITPQEQYLHTAKTWIERLDQAQNPQGMNMYVYYVQNAKAKNLADLLTQLFEGKRRRAAASEQASKARQTVSVPSEEGAAAPTSQARENARVSSIETGDVSILADLESNSLLILATPGDYAEVEKAIEKLDILPMQVLVEASILEVTLDDELEYGLQWFFKGSPGDKSSIGGLNIPASGQVFGEDGTALTGALADPVDFTYAVFDAAGTRLVINAVSGDSRIDVLSSPSLLVLDNQKAIIKVGDQVPIRTSESNYLGSSVANDNFVGTNVVSTIEYRDTGVTLEITPRVNSGGMVMMEVTQKVDDVDETTSSGIDSPTILQREITTSVAVQSGETVVLGGLIREGEETAASGIPFLRSIPMLGAAFGGKRLASRKTELIVMITPSAIANPQDARNVTEEYKAKLLGIDFSVIK